MDDNAARKRLRTDSDLPETAPSVVLRCSSRLYFPDGNIIIKTAIPADAPKDIYESSGKEQGAAFALLYRVHTSILARQCGFFSSLFSGSQEAFGVATEKYDGAPIMELPDDDWQAVDDFLKAMYVPNYLSHTGSPPSERDGTTSRFLVVY
ncbi:unnamed protein product [Peniophora sp. CBMAI 1063]|nr:unnamed protein product [Peniophora sp. CBMAI 1063]